MKLAPALDRFPHLTCPACGKRATLWLLSASEQLRRDPVWGSGRIKGQTHGRYTAQVSMTCLCGAHTDCRIEVE